MFTTFPKQHFERFPHPPYKQGLIVKLARVELKDADIRQNGCRCSARLLRSLRTW